MSIDIKCLQSGGKVVVEADKTSNLYQVTPERYKQLIHQNVIKNYKLAPPGNKDNVDQRTRVIANKLNVDERMERYTETESFISLKDHKENFYSNPTCRLINPAKSNLGKISKKILERITAKIKTKTGQNQWKSSYEVISWFKKIQILKKA